ncbi:MAG: tape measure protein, partial [Campylobacteraceae bacterium]
MEKELRVRISAKDDATRSLENFKNAVYGATDMMKELVANEKALKNEIINLNKETKNYPHFTKYNDSRIANIRSEIASLKAERILLAKTPEFRTSQQYDVLNKRYEQGFISVENWNKSKNNLFDTNFQKIDTTNITNANAKMKEFGNTAQNTARLIKTVATAVASSYVIREYVQLADTYKLIEGRLSLVTKNNDELVASQQALFNISQQTRQSYESTAELYTSLVTNTQNLGKSQKQQLELTESINKALIVSGATSSASSAALLQLGQAFAMGTLRGQELNSIMAQT